MAYGSQQKTALIGLETTPGTTVTADKSVGIVREVSDTFSRELRDIDSIGQSQVVAIETGMEEVGHSLTIDFQNGRLLDYALGSVAHDDSDTPDILHTFSINDSKPYFTLESGEDGASDVTLTSGGNLIENLELSIEINGVLQMSVTTRALNLASGTSTSAAVVDTLATFPHSLVSIELDDTVVPEVQNFSISIENSVVQTPGLGSNTYQSSQVTLTKFRFQGQIGVTNATYQALVIANTEAKLELIASNEVTAGSGRREVYFRLDNCHFDSMEKTLSVGDLVFLNVSGSGEFNTAYTYDNITEANWE